MMGKWTKYGIGLVAASVLGGYFLIAGTEKPTAIKLGIATTQPDKKTKPDTQQSLVSPVHTTEATALKKPEKPVTILKEAEPVPQEQEPHPIEQKAPAIATNDKPKDVSEVESQPVAVPIPSKKMVPAPAAQKEEQPKASGHFGTAKSSIQFHSTVIDSLHVAKDHLAATLSTIAANKFAQGKGRFYTMSAVQHGFSGNVPAMTLMTEDDYDHYMAILADANREKQGYIFHFPFDKWQHTTDNDELTKLLNDAKPLQKNIELILVRGHADSTGTDAYNLQLSAERAQTIAGVFPDVPLILEAVGEKEPVADNISPQGMSLNRRAEIFFIMKKPDEDIL